MEIIQQFAALSHHDEQTTAGAVILLVGLQMLGQRINALSQQRNLHVCGTSVLLVQPKLLNRISFNLHKILQKLPVATKKDRLKNTSVKHFHPFLPNRSVQNLYPNH